MAKISTLPQLLEPDGTETVVLLHAGTTKRAPIAGLVAGAVSTGLAPLIGQIRRIPVNDEGIVPVEYSSSGRIVRGRYLDGRAFDPNCEVTLPANDDGLVPTIVVQRGGSFYLVRGRYLDGRIYEPGRDLFLPPDDDGLVPTIVARRGSGFVLHVGRRLDGRAYPANDNSSNMETIFADDPRLTIFGYAGLAERSALRLRPVRPVSDGQGYEWCAPGMRCAFYTTARSVRFDVTFNGTINGRVIRDDAFQTMLASVLVDGVHVDDIADSHHGPEAVDASRTVALPAGLKRVDLVWPYSEQMDLRAIAIGAGGGIGRVTAPSIRFVAGGDSITHGFTVPGVLDTWSFQVADSLGLELVNMGFGGRTAVGADGAKHGALGGRIGTYCIGYNDWNNNVSLATFRAQILDYIAGWFAANTTPNADLILITAPYSVNTGQNSSGNRLQDFRATMTDAFSTYMAAHPAARLHLQNGLALFTNTADRLIDGIHPNKLGTREWSTNLSPVISALL